MGVMCRLHNFRPTPKITRISGFTGNALLFLFTAFVVRFPLNASLTVIYAEMYIFLPFINLHVLCVYVCT